MVGLRVIKTTRAAPCNSTFRCRFPFPFPSTHAKSFIYFSNAPRLLPTQLTFLFLISWIPFTKFILNCLWLNGKWVRIGFISVRVFLFKNSSFLQHQVIVRLIFSFLNQEAVSHTHSCETTAIYYSGRK